MKVRCPHGSPWYVECWPCADEVVVEFERKVVNFDLARRSTMYSYPVLKHRFLAFGFWPRGCGPKPDEGPVVFADEPWAEDPFFDAEHVKPEQIPPSGGTVFQFVEPEPLNKSLWLRMVAEAKRRLFGRHLNVVK